MTEANFVPRLYVATCEDHHVISQALFLLANDEVLGHTLLGLAAGELTEYLLLNERLVHTEHTDEGQLKIKTMLADLYSGLDAEEKRKFILDLPETQVTNTIRLLKPDGT